MGLFERIKMAVEALTEKESVIKGNSFEKYVVNLFDMKYFSVVEWTTDMSRKHNCYVESDCYPDLVIRYKPTNEMFCIECKYRSYLAYDGFPGINDRLDWSYPGQIERYQNYQRTRNLPFFVVVGLGGSSSYPERMFCIPLSEAKKPAIYPNVFEKYERNPNSNFFWNGEILR